MELDFSETAKSDPEQNQSSYPVRTGNSSLSSSEKITRRNNMWKWLTSRWQIWTPRQKRMASILVNVRSVPSDATMRRPLLWEAYEAARSMVCTSMERGIFLAVVGIRNWRLMMGGRIFLERRGIEDIHFYHVPTSWGSTGQDATCLGLDKDFIGRLFRTHTNEQEVSKIHLRDLICSVWKLCHSHTHEALTLRNGPPPEPFDQDLLSVGTRQLRRWPAIYYRHIPLAMNPAFLPIPPALPALAALPVLPIFLVTLDNPGPPEYPQS